MGITYIPLPLDDETKEWLVQEEVEYPPNASSRLPSFKEIKETISKFADHEVTLSDFAIGSPFEAVITSRECSESYTSLVIEELKENQNFFVFEKGDPRLVIEILRKMSELTGPLVLTTDSEEGPFVIWKGCDAQKIVDEWYFDDEEEFISADPITSRLLEIGFEKCGKNEYRKKLFDGYKIEIEVNYDYRESFEGIFYCIYSTRFKKFMKEIYNTDEAKYKLLSNIIFSRKSRCELVLGSAFLDKNDSDEYIFINGGRYVSLNSYIQSFSSFTDVKSIFEFVYYVDEQKHCITSFINWGLLFFYLELGLNQHQISKELKTGIARNWKQLELLNEDILSLAENVYKALT